MRLLRSWFLYDGFRVSVRQRASKSAEYELELSYSYFKESLKPGKEKLKVCRLKVTGNTVTTRQQLFACQSAACVVPKTLEAVRHYLDLVAGSRNEKVI